MAYGQHSSPVPLSSSVFVSLSLVVLASSTSNPRLIHKSCGYQQIRVQKSNKSTSPLSMVSFSVLTRPGSPQIIKKMKMKTFSRKGTSRLPTGYKMLLSMISPLTTRWNTPWTPSATSPSLVKVALLNLHFSTGKTILLFCMTTKTSKPLRSAFLPLTTQSASALITSARPC